jgi:ABC-2 type transport system ATP-binding protein
VLTEKAFDRPPDHLVQGVEDARIEAVEPRFEDRFVSRLIEETGGGPELPERPPADQRAGADERIIEVDGVKRRFGDFWAVKGIDFSVHRGEVFGLLGANGAGKSTTFRMLCGLLPVSGGRLRVAGNDLRRAAAKARADIGYMAQRFSLYEDLSVHENLKFFSSAYGLFGRRRKKRLDWAMSEFQLEDYRNTAGRLLPLGYKQRLALAAALMHEPDILFLDEPTSGVDPLARREFWHRINVLSESGVTVLVTTHFMEEAEYCDRLVIMVEGEIMAEGAPEDLKDDYRSEDNPQPTMEDAFVGLIEDSEGRA